MELDPATWVCVVCGKPDTYGSNGGCPNCGSQNEIVPYKVYLERTKMIREALEEYLKQPEVQERLHHLLNPTPDEEDWDST